MILENSKIGLKLLDTDYLIKRLAKNDLDLIEHIARTNLKMVGKDELVLIPGESENKSKPNNQYTKPLDDFRILKEDKFKELLNFNILSLKFYEKLNTNKSSGEGEAEPKRKSQ